MTTFARAIVLLLLSSAAASAAITRVQTKTGNSGGTGVPTYSLTFDSALTAGNYVVVCVATNGGARITSTGITWMGRNYQGATSTTSMISFGLVLSGASAQVDFASASTGGIAVVMAEYAATNLVVDKTAMATATSTAPDSGAPPTATATDDQLWVGCIAHRISGGATFSDPGGGFTIVGQAASSIGSTADRSVCFLEKIVTATGTPNASATVSASGVWAAQILTFYEVPTGGGGGETSATFSD